MEYSSISEIKEANRRYALQSAGIGNHWFDTDTMRFFGTRVHSQVYAGKYFVTSEYKGFGDYERAYTVREAREDGSIDTVGDFLGYETRAEAHAAARKMA